MKLTEKQINSIYGFIIGDCLGVPYEFTQPKIKTLKMIGNGTHDQPKGTWSDDTSFLLATLDCDFLDKNTLLDNMKRVGSQYTSDGYLFDIGGATLDALKGKKNTDFILQDGNGSLMRILPYSFVEHEFLYEKIAESSYITHQSAMASFCCVVYVKLIKEALKGNYNFFEILESEYDESGWHLSKYKLDDTLTYNGFVWHSLLAVVDIADKAKSYSGGVKMAINLGGDTDTHSALVGALLAIKFNDWKKFVKEIRNVETVKNVINKRK